MLECWNNGKLGFGLMVKFVLKTIKKLLISLKNHYSIIPQFHLSRIEAKEPSLKSIIDFH